MELRLTGMVSGRRRTWSLDLPVLRLGRAERNAIAIPDSCVSTEHAEISLAGGRWGIRDLGSRNGTWVNGARIAAWTALEQGDLIEVGRTRLMVEERADSSSVEFARDSGETTLSRMPVPDTGPTHVIRPEQIPAAELLERTHAEARLLGIVGEAGRRLTQAHTEREAAEAVLAILARIADFSRLVLLLRDGPRGPLVPIARRPDDAGALRVTPRIVEQVLAGHAAVVRMSESGRGFVMMAPLVEEDHAFGLVYGERGGRPGEHLVGEQALFNVTAQIGAAKIANERLRARELEHRLTARQLADAAVIQRSELRAAPSDIDGWHFHAQCEPCGEVGGDFYDFHLRTDGRLVVTLGDIVGKGPGAALRMSWVLSAARIIYDLCDDPRRLVGWLDDHVRSSFDRFSFVTQFVGCLEPASGRLHYVNAGHPYALHAGARGLTELATGGLPLGLGQYGSYEMGQTLLEPGDSLLMVSDGVLEARRGEELFGFERLGEVFSGLAPLRDPLRIGRGITACLDDFLGGEPREDDLTLLVVTRD
jgi:serine phosphatase RsbU (regulator of sigma subunit)